MKTSIVYSTTTGNTQLLADRIQSIIGADCTYCGKASDEALDADCIFIGFWAMKFTCDKSIEKFLTKVENKKVFIFGTAGYNNTAEFFAPIIESVKALVPASNEIIGSYICQGKVSEAKQAALKEMDAAKFEDMKPNIDKGAASPTAVELDLLSAAVKQVYKA